MADVSAREQVAAESDPRERSRIKARAYSQIGSQAGLSWSRGRYTATVVEGPYRDLDHDTVAWLTLRIERDGVLVGSPADVWRFVNGPLLVDDPAGDVEVASANLDGVVSRRLYREDVTAAFREALIARTKRAMGGKSEAVLLSDPQRRPGAPRVKQAPHGTTTVVYSAAADGYLNCFSTTYSSARSGAGTLGVGVVAAAIYAGQRLDGSDYGVFLGYPAFDTSSIPDTDTVATAIMNLTANADNNDATGYQLNVRPLDWGATLTTADHIPGASLTGLTPLLAHAASSAFATDVATDLTDDAMAAYVNKTGVTRMILSSSRTEAGTVPTAYEYNGFYSEGQSGTSKDPSLTVTHAYAPTATLAVTGGGSFAAASTKGALGALAVTGGGSYAQTASKAAASTLAVTGGGSVALPASKAAAADLTVTGGGSVVLPASKAAVSALTVTGGGSFAAASTKGALGALAVTGGGSVALPASKAALLAALSITGGGSVAISYTVDMSSESHSGTVSVTGGGSFALLAFKGALGILGINGGGSVGFEASPGPARIVLGSGPGPVIAYAPRQSPSARVPTQVPTIYVRRERPG